MTLKGYYFEGASSGTAQTAGNTGATLVAANGGTATFDSGTANTGSCGGKWVATGTNSCLTRFAPNASSLTMAVHGIFKTPATAPGTYAWITVLRNTSDTGVAYLLLGSDRHLYQADTGLTHYYDTGIVLATGTQYRIEWRIVVGTTTSNGVSDLSVYPVTGSTTTPLNNTSASHVTNANYGTTAIVYGDWGISSGDASNAGLAFGWDEISYNDGSTSEIGIYVPPTPPADTVGVASVTSNAGGYTANGAANLVAAVPQPPGSDGIYAAAPTGSGDKVIVYRLNPLTSAPNSVSVEASNTVAGGSIKIELLQGSTVIATAGPTTLTASRATYTLTLTSGERGAVTDPTTLDVRLTGVN